MLGELGRGAFGCALKARRRRDGALVCIKVLDSASMGAAERRMVRAGRRGQPARSCRLRRQGRHVEAGVWCTCRYGT